MGQGALAVVELASRQSDQTHGGSNHQRTFWEVTQMADATLTQERVRQLFDYREDGNLIRRQHVNVNARAGGCVGSVSVRGYVETSVGGKRFYVHRLIFLWHHGVLPPQIDHKNGDRLDNRIENLRAVSVTQNNWNTSARGTFRVSGRKRWCAQIYMNGKSTHLGCFDTEEEAHQEYLRAKSKVHVIGDEVATCHRR